MHDHAIDTVPARPPHPLVTRLETDFGWPRLAPLPAVAEFTGRPGAQCLFVPGDAARNLETPDAATAPCRTRASASASSACSCS